MLLSRNMEDQIMLQLIVKGYVFLFFFKACIPSCRRGGGGLPYDKKDRRIGVLGVPFRG